jgi:hypothetical protein
MNCENLPSTLEGYLIVSEAFNNVCVQFFVTSENSKSFIRTCWYGSWREWREFSFES